jgi:hypothetical protein
MAPQTAYGGPTALAHSKHASPSMRQAQLATFPAAVSSTKNAPANNTIATREQIAATHEESAVDVARHNSDAQLAIAQGNALKEEVDHHAAHFSRTISSAVTNTRRLLELIREAVQKEDPTALKSVDNLWTELEQLFKASQGTKEALPNFLEKQRNNMALYHASVMNETYRDSQDELNIQYRKVSDRPSLVFAQRTDISPGQPPARPHPRTPTGFSRLQGSDRLQAQGPRGPPRASITSDTGEGQLPGRDRQVRTALGAGADYQS